MDAIEGRRDVGGRNTEYQKLESKDLLRSLVHLVRKDSATRDSANINANDNGGRVEDWGGYEFDGIRSEVDFRRAMELEEERLRGTWTQRTWRVFGSIRANLLSWRGLRFLR